MASLLWKVRHKMGGGLSLQFVTDSDIFTRSFDGPARVVERSEDDAVYCRDLFNFCYTIRGDEASSLREGLEPVFQGESHPLQKTAVDNVRKWMPVQYSVKIRIQMHAVANLSESAKENACMWHGRIGGKVFGIASVANDCVRHHVSQQ